MSIPKNIMLFREKRASELRMVAKSLEKTIGGGINTSPILQAAKQLEDINFIPTLKDGTRDPNFWGYEIEDFIIPVETIKHIRPKGIKDVSITLNMKVIANSNEWLTLSDPLADLNFNVLIRGIGTESCYAGFHIDRHDMNLVSTEPHPIYHLQYMVNPLDSDDFNYGSVLHLDTPRIMHYPMDFILGMGFLTSNFYPTAFEVLLDDGIFTSLYKEYQERIWKPFAHTMANHWDFDKANIIWKPTSTLCPYLI